MREFLKGLDLDKETIDTIMAEHGKLLTASKERADALKTTLDEVQGKLKSFEGVDIDALQGQIATLQADIASKDAEYQGKIADMEFNSSLAAAVTAAKGKNAKAISAMLDMNTLKASKNQEADIKAALNALKESDGYLFEAETPPPYASGTGTNNMSAPPADVFQEKINKYSKI